MTHGFARVSCIHVLLARIHPDGLPHRGRECDKDGTRGIGRWWDGTGYV